MLSPFPRAGGKARDFCRVSADLPRLVWRAVLVSPCLTSGLGLAASTRQTEACCGLPGLYLPRINEVAICPCELGLLMAMRS